jgi:hypothetical protein
LTKETLCSIALNLENSNHAAKGSALKALIRIFSNTEGGPVLTDASSLQLVRTAVARHLTCILQLCQDGRGEHGTGPALDELDNANACRALELLTLLLDWNFVDYDVCYPVCRAVLQRPNTVANALLHGGKWRERAIDLFHLVFAKRCMPLCLDRQEDAEREVGDRHITECWTSLLALTYAGNEASAAVTSAAANLARGRCIRQVRCLKALALLLNEFSCGGSTSPDSGRPLVGESTGADASSTAAEWSAPSSSAGPAVSSCELVEALMKKNDEMGALLCNWPFVLACLLQAGAVNAVKAPDVLGICTKSPARQKSSAGCRSLSSVPGTAPSESFASESKSSPRCDGDESTRWMGSVCDIVILSLLHDCSAVAGTKHEPFEAGASVAREMHSHHDLDRGTEHVQKRETAALRLLTFLADTCSSSASSPSAASQHTGRLDEISGLISCFIPDLPMQGCSSDAEVRAGTSTRADRSNRAVAQLMARVCTRTSLQGKLALFQLSLN